MMIDLFLFARKFPKSFTPCNVADNFNKDHF